MNVSSVFNGLSAQDQSDILVGLGCAAKRPKKRDLLKGGLGEFKRTGYNVRMSCKDITVASLYELGTLYAYALGLLK